MAKEMVPKPSLTIDKVEWHTQTPGNTESAQSIHTRFRSVIDFLQREQLTTRIILRSSQSISDNVEIHTDDLTDEGFALIKKCYSKWLGKVDNGLSPDDVSIFEKELGKIRRG